MVYKNGKAVAMSLASGNEVSQPSQDIYSTEETVIGTWIDGKPLYRKVYSIITNEVSPVRISVENLNADTMVSICGRIFVIGNNGHTYFNAIPYNDGTNILYFNCDLTTKYVQFVYNNATYSNRQADIWLEYTKTTDQPSIAVASFIPEVTYAPVSSDKELTVTAPEFVSASASSAKYEI